MKLFDRLREHREQMQQRVNDGEKGSVVFWFQVISMLYQVWKLFRKS